MSYYTALDIYPEPLTLDGIAYMNYHKAVNKNQHFRSLLNVSKHVRSEIVELFDQCNLYIRFGELFYTPADCTTSIHIDSEPGDYMVPNNMAKINYVGGGKGSLMNWYETFRNKQYTPTGMNKFISYRPYEVRLVGQGNLTGYNVTQTGIPHNVTTTAESRYCVSLTLAIKGEAPKLIPYELLASMLTKISRASSNDI